MKLLRKAAVLFLFSASSMLVASSAWARKPVKISSLEEITPGIVVEIESRDQTVCLAASAEEAIVKGISYTTAKNVAQKVATLKAKAILADFINGSELEDSTIVTQQIEKDGEKANEKSTVRMETANKMRTTLLRGVEVIKVIDNPDAVMVVVGFGGESLRIADKYMEIQNDRTDPESRVPDKKSSIVSPPTSRRNWTHPDF